MFTVPISTVRSHHRRGHASSSTVHCLTHRTIHYYYWFTWTDGGWTRFNFEFLTLFDGFSAKFTCNFVSFLDFFIYILVSLLEVSNRNQKDGCRKRFSCSKCNRRCVQTISLKSPSLTKAHKEQYENGLRSVYAQRSLVRVRYYHPY